jgi:Bacterial PH domain
MIYRSKIDPWAPFVLIMLIGSQIAIGLIFLIREGAGSVLGWSFLTFVPAILLLVVLLVVLLVAWPMTYDPGAIRSDGDPILLVRGGLLLRYEIPIARIKEVRPSKSVLSSMSLSYDRVEVISSSPTGFPGPMLISPRDRDAFLDDLARRAGDLVRVGDRLTRRQDAHAAP